jgi:uncharacterized LabA/DUF88 family protein
MIRFAIFVDGSNLFGSLKRLNLQVADYSEFFIHILKNSLEEWKSSVFSGSTSGARLSRVLWYEVGSIDDWDLASPKAQAQLKEWFDVDSELKKIYMPIAAGKLPGASQDKIALEAWSICFNETKAWYVAKRVQLDGMKRFHFGVSASSDFIDIIESGHWKIDLLSRSMTEKGIDTSLAVDMVTLADTYDVALVVSGDADSIPSIQHVKRAGKHVGVVELIKGYPPEKKGRQFSSKLKIAADFVVRVYEMDLVRSKIGVSPEASTATPKIST